MLRVQKDDVVYVVAGKDKGKTGKVLKVLTGENRAVVQGINFIKLHMRRAREGEQAGIVQKEASISLSNIMPVCKHCNKPTRVGFQVLKDKTKTRICRRCQEAL